METPDAEEQFFKDDNITIDCKPGVGGTRL